MSAPKLRTSSFFPPSENERSFLKKMSLNNRSLFPPGPQASTVCQSITQEHTAFVTNWQTNIFHFCSSSVLFSFFLDNPHNNLSGVCMTTQRSLLLSVDSAQRTGGYQCSNTPHLLRKHFEYITASCQTVARGQNADLITFHCVPHMFNTE